MQDRRPTLGRDRREANNRVGLLCDRTSTSSPRWYVDGFFRLMSSYVCDLLETIKLFLSCVSKRRHVYFLDYLPNLGMTTFVL